MLDMVRNSISRSPDAAALFFDELARVIQQGIIDPRVEVSNRALGGLDKTRQNKFY